MKNRGSGILMHITSLPSKYGIGDFGPEALEFVEFLAGSGQDHWQILPLHPTELSSSNSPYNSISSFAGNHLLISPEYLVRDGFLKSADLEPLPRFPADNVDYETATTYKNRLLENAWRRWKGKEASDPAYLEFCEKNSGWLEDYALFKALKSRHGERSWNEWPAALRDREPGALRQARAQFNEDVAREKFFQYLFDYQWTAVKTLCHDRNIQIVGDMPIYVHYDSAEVWVNPGIFKLDAGKRPAVVAGVPPDYFSATGQWWGNPVYDWNALRAAGYAWWIMRMTRMFELYDVVRIDHFRGFVNYWEIPAAEKVAARGRWEQAPAEDFFETLLKRFPCFPVIAEDLGLITADVREVVQQFGFPGMKVLLFAFGEDNPRHIYLPHMYQENFVAYTGTHDTNTLQGWFQEETTPEMRERLFTYLGRAVPESELHWEMIRLLFMSSAYLVMLPMQDVLGLNGTTRMNTPSRAGGNWRWRLASGFLTKELSKKLRGLARTYGRA